MQPLADEVMARASSNTTDGARLDMAVNGLWGGHFETTYLDVRVFNPSAATNTLFISVLFHICSFIVALLF